MKHPATRMFRGGVIVREPLPFRGPSRVPVRALLAATVAAGTAAFLGVGLTRDIPAWITIFGATLSALLAAAWITLRARHRLLFVAPLIFLGGVLSALTEPFLFPYPHEVGFVYAPVVGAIIAAIFTAVCAPLFTIVARAADVPSHDVLERVLVRLAAWLGVVGAGSAGLNVWWGRSLSTLGAGGLTRALLILALTGGAATAILVLLRDAGRLRWITRIHRGARATWTITRRDEVQRADLLPYLAPTAADGAMATRTVEGHAPFRSSETWTPLAWIPLDPSKSKRLLRRRAALAALLALVQGAGATALGVVGWRHRLPLSGVTGVAVGMYHACALLEDRSVRCWGWLPNRETDGGLKGETHYAPVAIAGIDDATQIASARSFGCALRAGGTVACWGSASGSTTKAVEMPGLAGVVRIAAGEKHACALQQDGLVRCWGAVDFLSPFGTPDRWHPLSMTMPEGRADAIDLVAGDGWTCLQRMDGVFCWQGIDAAPNAGIRGFPQRCPPWWTAKPGDPLPAGGPKTFAYTPGEACQSLADGRLRCWHPPEPRDGVTWGRELPACVEPILTGEPGPVRRLAFSWAWRCELDGARVLSCVEARSKQTVTLDGVEDFAVGFFSVCAVRADRTAHCWGDYNDDGQLGDGTRRAHMTPVVVRR